MNENPELEKEVFDFLYKLKNGDDNVRSMFRKLVNVCIDGQTSILGEFGIKYNTFNYESEFCFNSSINSLGFHCTKNNLNSHRNIHVIFYLLIARFFTVFGKRHMPRKVLKSKDFYVYALCINTTVSAWPELPLLMSGFSGTGQPFFNIFEVGGNMSKIYMFAETYPPTI